MGSRYLAGKKRKTKRSQFIIKLDAMALAMIVEIVPDSDGSCKRVQQVM